MKIKGIVEIIIADIDGNIKDQRLQENLIPDNTWVSVLGADPPKGAFVSYSQINGIFLTNISISTSTSTPVASNYTITGIIGTATRQSLAWNESVDPPYGTMIGLINPINTTRTFNSVAITYLSAADNQNISSTTALAWLLLDLPCTQNPTDYVNITYTIQFVDDIGQGYIDNKLARYDFARAMWGSADPNGNNNGFRISQIATTICSPSSATPVDLPYADKNISSILNYVSSQSVPSFFKYKYSLAPGYNDLLGLIINAFTQGKANDNIRAYCLSRFVYDKEPFQTGFAHGVSSVIPFFDNANLANSQGVMTLAGTWVNKLPEFYKIMITASGTATSATYKFSVLKHLGFTGNTYTIPTCQSIYRNTSVKYANNLHGWQEANFDVFSFGDSKIVQYDATGVSIVDLIDGGVQTWDIASTPPLGTTAIFQIAIDLANKKIYVADRSSGLFIIDTVANSIATAFSGACYGVDVGRNAVAYAIKSGGIYHSSDSFTTALSFTYTGISDGNWSRVKFLKADPENTNDRLAIVADNGSGQNIIVWYEASSSTVTTGYTHPRLPSYSASLGVSNTGSTWIFHLADHLFYKIAFASSSISNQYNGYGKQVGSDSTFYAKIGFYKDSAIGGDGFIGGTVTTSYAVGIPYNFSTGIHDSTSFAIHLNSGIVFLTNFICQILPVASAWINYGWNGSGWDTVSTGSKTCHTDQETLINGLTIAFQNGSTTPQFLLNEFFTQGICKGLLKDNATQFVFNPQWYSKPIAYDTVSMAIPSSNTINLPATSNIFFRSIDTDTTGVHSFTINGVAVTHTWTDSTVPASSEINLQASGVVTFNSADQGKTFAGTYLWIGV
jgi:hypothetical protein